MKKIIALSSVLALGALGMACGEGATNVNVNANKANMNTTAPVNTATPMATMTPAATAPSNTGSTGTTGTNGNMNAKPSNTGSSTTTNSTAGNANANVKK